MLRLKFGLENARITDKQNYYVLMATFDLVGHAKRPTIILIYDLGFPALTLLELQRLENSTQMYMYNFIIVLRRRLSFY